MAQDVWIVFKTTNPTWGTLGLGVEVAELIGLTRFEDGKWDSNRGMVAFLDRGRGKVRVISVFRSAQLFADSIVQQKMVGQAVATEKLILNLPDDVEKHLGVDTKWVPERKARRTLDTLAWIIPSEEYYAYREATKDGKAYEVPPEGPAHVYLVRSNFPGLIGTKRSLEGEEPEVPVPRAALPRAKKIG